LDNEIDRKIDVTAILFLLVHNRQQTHDWTLIGSGTNGLSKQEWIFDTLYLKIWHYNVNKSYNQAKPDTSTCLLHIRMILGSETKNL